MPVGRMLVRSEKSDLWGKSPSDLGPGQYNPENSNFKISCGSAPFSSTSERNKSDISEQTPGPGSYEVNSSLLRVSTHASPGFISQTERIGGELSRLKHMDTPGPGSYTPIKDTQYQHKQAQRFHTGEGINWVKVATAPSIPSNFNTFGYEEGAGGSLVPLNIHVPSDSTPGPGFYDSSLEKVRSHGKIFQKFRKCHSPPRQPDPLPGPGSYDVGFVQDSQALRGGVGSKRMNSVFSSTTGRAKLSAESYGPGPGGYGMQSSFRSLREHLAANPDSYSAFGSSVPNPRVILADNKLPGPGTYSTEVSHSASGPSSPFLSSSERFNSAHTGIFTPGPGSYEDPRNNFTHSIDSKIPGRFGVFGTTSTRFPQKRVDEVPPVGSYNVENRSASGVRKKDVRSSSFRSPDRSRKNQVDDRPIGFLPNEKWGREESFSKAFISTVPRFGLEKISSVPGPGSYSSGLNLPRGNLNRVPGFGVGPRFTNDGSQNTPGPGSYNQRSSLESKKSFNITIGDKW